MGHGCPRGQGLVAALDRNEGGFIARMAQKAAGGPMGVNGGVGGSMRAGRTRLFVSSLYLGQPRGFANLAFAGNRLSD
jgi:hypothetical protein